MNTFESFSLINHFLYIAAECTQNSECVSDRACINQHCVDPCSYTGSPCGTDALCRTIVHEPQCYCPAGLQGNPMVACVVVGCSSNDDCPETKACNRINRVCVDVCTPVTCAPGADCRASNHAAFCYCPPGYIGNPFQHCSKRK